MICEHERTSLAHDDGGVFLQLKVAVCDDETIICEDTQRKIKEIKTDYTVDIYNNGFEILSAGKRYDMIFLDIEMPEQDGMRIAKKLREQRFKGHIIFLTSHTEFMPDAFKVKAFRFLQKPVDMEELRETVSEAEKEIFENKQVVVTDYGTEILINIPDILFVEAKKNKTIIHTVDEEMETNHTLKYWIKELGMVHFCQVHKSYLVSFRYIKKIDVDGITLYYTDTEIPVSRRNAALVKKAFFAYIKENAKSV